MQFKSLPIYLAFLFLVLFSSCSKEEEEFSDPVYTGGIAGKITPQRSILAVKAISLSDSSKVYTRNIEAATDFFLSNVPEGNYKVKLIPNPGFRAPADMTVPVTRNVTNQLGEYEIEKSSSFIFTYNNEVLSATIKKIAAYKNGSFLSITSGEIIKLQTKYLVDIYLVNFTGTGVYAFTNATTNSNVAYLTNDTGRWRSISGLMTVENYDIDSGLLKASFSFNGEPANSEATGMIQISEGRLNDIHTHN